MIFFKGKRELINKIKQLESKISELEKQKCKCFHRDIVIPKKCRRCKVRDARYDDLCSGCFDSLHFF